MTHYVVVERSQAVYSESAYIQNFYVMLLSKVIKYAFDEKEKVGEDIMPEMGKSDKKIADLTRLIKVNSKNEPVVAHYIRILGQEIQKKQEEK